MILSRKKTLVMKTETTAGTAETLTAAEAVYVGFDVSITPDENFIERAAQGTFSHEAGVQPPQTGTAKFKIELGGNGASVPPAWATTIFPALGLVASGAVFKVKSEAPGTSTKTLTIEVRNDGLVDRIYGAMGDAEFTFQNGQIAMADCTFRGIYWNGSGTTFTPTYPTIKTARFDHASVLWTSTIPCSTASIKLGNDVQVVQDATTSTGFKYAVITGRKVAGDLNPESARANAHRIAQTANTEAQLTIAVHNDTAAFNTATFVMPKAQRRNVSPADDGGVRRDAVSFQANRSAAAGDDELTVTFS
jgi:hypothetical protein